MDGEIKRRQKGKRERERGEERRNEEWTQLNETVAIGRLKTTGRAGGISSPDSARTHARPKKLARAIQSFTYPHSGWVWGARRLRVAKDASSRDKNKSKKKNI